MNSNPLQFTLLAYKTASDSFRIAGRAIKTQEPTARQRLLQRTNVETQTITDAERIMNLSHYLSLSLKIRFFEKNRIF